jgi:hypothetical protein
MTSQEASSAASGPPTDGLSQPTPPEYRGVTPDAEPASVVMLSQSAPGTTEALRLDLIPAFQLDFRPVALYFNHRAEGL